MSEYVIPEKPAELSIGYGPPEVVPRYTLYPTTVEVLAVQVSVTECGDAWTPDPDSNVLVGEFVALLAIVTLPVTLPVDVGAKLTVSATDCPAVSVSVDATPLALKPAPDIVTCEIVTIEFPVF